MLDEDIPDASTIIALTNEPLVYRYIFMSELDVTVSVGYNAEYRNYFQGGRSLEINSKLFMSSISDETKITVAPETYDLIMQLVKGIAEEDERELRYSSGVNIVIVTKDFVYEANHLPAGVHGPSPGPSIRAQQLAAILKEIAPLEIPRNIDRNW